MCCGLMEASVGRGFTVERGDLVGGRGWLCCEVGVKAFPFGGGGGERRKVGFCWLGICFFFFWSFLFWKCVEGLVRKRGAVYIGGCNEKVIIGVVVEGRWRETGWSMWEVGGRR